MYPVPMVCKFFCLHFQLFQVKAAVTRAYNKEKHLLPYATAAPAGGAKRKRLPADDRACTQIVHHTGALSRNFPKRS